MVMGKHMEEALKKIAKKYGDHAVMRLGDEPDTKIEVIQTGSIALDRALGIGGIPRGRITEIYGSESAGKTTLALHIIANAQKQSGEAAFIDVEHALDPAYSRELGVDTKNLLISQPSSGEEALNITEELVKSGELAVVVIDSVAALTPQAEIEGGMGDSHMGLQARLMSQAMRKLTSNVSNSNCAVIFINQLRMKIGQIFGNPETQPGGRALKFYSSVRLDIRRLGHLKDGDVVIGSKTKVKVVKNKLAPPFKQAEFELIHGYGISRESELIDMGLKNGILSLRGSWYSMGDQRIGQGREKVRKFLINKPEIADKLEEKIRKGKQ
jgi:recombination protein RecA